MTVESPGIGHAPAGGGRSHLAGASGGGRRSRRGDTVTDDTGSPSVCPVENNAKGAKMIVDRSKIRRARMASIDRQVRSDMRTSDLVLAVVGVALLGGLCLVGLANWVGAAKGLASMPVPAATALL